MKDGDIVTIDMVVKYDGWLADSAWSYPVGNVSEEAQHLLDVTKKALYLGIEQAVVGNRDQEIFPMPFKPMRNPKIYRLSAILSVTRSGKPCMKNRKSHITARQKRGTRLKEGMVITIEPMLNMGTYQVKIDSDGWTARTGDGKSYSNMSIHLPSRRMAR